MDRKLNSSKERSINGNWLNDKRQSAMEVHKRVRDSTLILRFPNLVLGIVSLNSLKAWHYARMPHRDDKD